VQQRSADLKVEYPARVLVSIVSQVLPRADSFSTRQVGKLPAATASLLEDLARGPVTKRLVQPFVVVEPELCRDGLPSLGDVLVGLQVGE
jgi:hypothetical protein